MEKFFYSKNIEQAIDRCYHLSALGWIILDTTWVYRPDRLIAIRVFKQIDKSIVDDHVHNRTHAAFTVIKN